MEGKLLCGGKNIIDHTNEQQKALEQRKREISEQKRREREMQQKLEEQEEAGINLQDTYTSLQQEVEIKTKKLKKVPDIVRVSPHRYISFKAPNS